MVVANFSPPLVEQDNNTNNDGNGGNNGGTDSGGTENGGNTENEQLKLLILPEDIDNFSIKSNGMYFALHITGKSEINEYTKLGLFAQNATNATQGKMPYARDLEIQVNINIPFKFSSRYEELQLTNKYNKNYGWTDKDGLNLDMPFYLWHSQFHIQENSLNKPFNFKNFVIEDMTVPGEFMGFAYMVRCNDDLKFNIQELEEKTHIKYNPNIHKNIALLTIEFRDGQCNDYTVTLDGFVEK